MTVFLHWAFFILLRKTDNHNAYFTSIFQSIDGHLADSLETMFTRGDAAQILAKLRRQDNGLFNRIRKFVDQWLGKLRQYYENRTVTQEGAAVAELKSFEKIQQMFLEAMAEAGENFSAAEVTNKKNTTQGGDARLSTKNQSGYGGIREVLAKQGLDALSKRYGDHFPLSSKFDAAMRADNTKLTMETVRAGSVKPGSQESAYKAGRKAFIAKYGTSTIVHIKQMGIDAMLYADVAKESISKAIGQSNEQSTLDVIPHIREVLSNSILMGVERIRHTDKKGTVLYGYRLYNLYWYSDGKTKVPHAIACTVLQDLNKAEGYVFQNIENVTIGQGLPGNTGMSPSVNDDTYTVAQLYKAVKKISRENGGLSYTQKEKDAYGFPYTETNDGEQYSLREESEVSTSPRALLANALESVAQTPMERQRLQEYRAKLDQINAQEQRLREVNAQIKEMTFSKGPKDRAKLQELKDEKVKAQNRLNIYDAQLLRLEGMKSIKDVLERERKKAWDKVKQQHKESRTNARKRELRKAVKKDISELKRKLDGTKKQNVKQGMKGLVRTAIASSESLFEDSYVNFP